MIGAILALAAGQAFACHVVSVHDGDGPLHCANGQSVRLAAIQAPDYTDAIPCREHRSGFTCNDALADRARDRMATLVLGHTLDCTALGQSYARTVASCRLGGRDLSCIAVREGIATYWARYDRAGTLRRLLTGFPLRQHNC